MKDKKIITDDPGSLENLKRYLKVSKSVKTKGHTTSYKVTKYDNGVVIFENVSGKIKPSKYIGSSKKKFLFKP